MGFLGFKRSLKVPHGEKIFEYPDARIYGDKKKTLKPPEMRRDFSMREIQESHHEIARQLVLGRKPKEIARELEVSYQTVINVKNLPNVKEQIDLLSGARDAAVYDAAKALGELVPQAVKVLEEILHDEEIPTDTRGKYALATLDRNGFSPVRRIDMRSVNAMVTSDDLERIRARALEIGRSNNLISEPA